MAKLKVTGKDVPTIIGTYGNEREALLDIAEFIEGGVDGRDYDVDVHQAAQHTADNAGKMLGRLIALLADKGVLTGQDVLELAKYPDVSKHYKIKAVLVKERIG